MESVFDQIKEADRKSIQSKVQFQGDFHEELKDLVGEIEENITKKIIPNYGVEYTEYGSHSLKIKINDKNLMCEKLIICNFVYKKNDEKYGHITPQFIVSEKGQKTKKYDMEKFPLRETDKITEQFLLSLEKIIEEF
ncbi:MAG: hypothetical protein GY828_08295 [Candidatus Gracilibacteria bacterium]|nr:hypothetical protein [Candidatus Gracilibacteria bacterium]